MAICCFAGHTMLYDDTIKQLIYKECIKHIEKNNVLEFWVEITVAMTKLLQVSSEN